MGPLVGFSSGLSVGVYCIGICLPIFVPLILADKQNVRSSLRIVLEFSVGRLLGYLLHGILIGYLGVAIESNFMYKLVSLATLFMGLTMVVYALGFLKWGHSACKLFFGRVKVPILLGFLTGVNVCPPFLASLTYVFSLKSVLKAAIYFATFFLGTSVYIVPLGALGFLSYESTLQKVARVSGVFVGIYFIYVGLRVLFG